MSANKRRDDHGRQDEDDENANDSNNKKGGPKGRLNLELMDLSWLLRRRGFCAAPFFLFSAAPFFRPCAAPFTMVVHHVVIRFNARYSFRSNQHAVVEHISIKLLMLSGDNSGHLNEPVGRRSFNPLHVRRMHISGASVPA